MQDGQVRVVCTLLRMAGRTKFSDDFFQYYFLSNMHAMGGADVQRSHHNTISYYHDGKAVMLCIWKDMEELMASIFAKEGTQTCYPTRREVCCWSVQLDNIGQILKDL